MTKRDELQANDAVWARFYRDGHTLGQIAQEFDCGIYDLSPWLTVPLMRAINDMAMHSKRSARLIDTMCHQENKPETN